MHSRSVSCYQDIICDRPYAVQAVDCLVQTLLEDLSGGRDTERHAFPLESAKGSVECR